jgi:hypothetical protein
MAIIWFPAFLLVDFGIAFLTHLRGGGTFTNVSYEFFLDHLNIIIFFIRLAVQFVRILLMVITYVMVHEVLEYQVIHKPFGMSNEDFLDSL